MKKLQELQTTLTRRDALAGVAAAGIAAAMARFGAVTPAQAQAAELVVGTIGGAWLEGIKKIFIEETGFTEKHNATVAWDTQNDAGLITKALSSCGDPIYDMLQASATGAARLTEAGCLQALDPAIVTNLAQIDDTYKSSEYLVATVRLISGIVYNTKHIKTPPQSWNDLKNPEFKGKVGIPDYGWIGPQFLHSINKAFGGDEDNIDPGIAASAEIVRGNNAVMVQHTNMADQLFQQEEIWVMPFWTGRMLNLQASGVPVDIYYQENFFVIDLGYVVPKGPNSALAQELLNVTLDPSVQLRLLENFKYQPVNRNVEIPEEFRSAVLPDYAKNRAAVVDWIKVNKNADRDLDRWNREVMG